MIKHKTLAKADDCPAADNDNSSTIDLVNDKSINSHSHVHCLDTGKTLEVKFNFSNSSIEQAIKEIEQKTGIQIIECRLDLLGYQNLKNR